MKKISLLTLVLLAVKIITAQVVGNAAIQTSINPQRIAPLTNPGSSGYVLTYLGSNTINWQSFNSTAWLLTGNSGTTPGTNFLGTTDNTDLEFRANNVRCGDINIAGFNTSWGYSALPALTTGQNNSGFGFEGLDRVTSGVGNTGIGYAAGDAITTGSFNLLIGYGADVTSNSLVNAIGIGKNAIARSSNSMSIDPTDTMIQFPNYCLVRDSIDISLVHHYLYPLAGQVQVYEGKNRGWVFQTLSGGSGGSGWNLTGNSGTTPGTNFLGTTDSVAVELKTNGQVYGKFSPGSGTMILGEYGLYNNTTGSGIAIGYKSLFNNTSGIHNGAIGSYCLYSNTTGSSNCAICYDALYSNTTGIMNVAIGDSTLFANTTGRNNVAVGFEALSSNTVGLGNTGIGMYAGNMNTTGSSNTAVGRRALYSNVGGDNNVAIGDSALYANTSGINNAAIGYQCLAANTTGSYNYAMGYNALAANTTQSYNTAIGINSMENATTNSDVAIGYYTCNTDNGGANTAIGYAAMENNTSGLYSCAYGYEAMQAASGMQGSIGIGYQALYHDQSIGYNIGIGFGAMQSTSLTGYENVAIGLYSGLGMTSGIQNTFLGETAGESNTTGSNNTLIGSGANVNAGTYTNSTGIGNGVTITASNQAKIGNTSLQSFVLGAGAYGAPVQISSATSGTVVANGSQILQLNGASANVTITEPATPFLWETFELTTSQPLETITWTNPSNFYGTPPATVTNTQGHAFYYDGTMWVMKY